MVPTGNIFIREGAKGKLEMLSIGDYGKEVLTAYENPTKSKEIG